MRISARSVGASRGGRGSEARNTNGASTCTWTPPGGTAGGGAVILLGTDAINAATAGAGAAAGVAAGFDWSSSAARCTEIWTGQPQFATTGPGSLAWPARKITCSPGFMV